mmetsp:Transcript_5705/g.8996  ORF Transcript_5705/g.8996 Transcript_5705/m.8996 type:complete len:229 (+) Transcript_5705:181-867(+)
MAIMRSSLSRRSVLFLHLQQLLLVVVALVSSGILPTVAQATSCFQTREELQHAVKDYVQDPSSNSLVATTYGWPIGSWCVDTIGGGDNNDAANDGNITDIAIKAQTLLENEDFSGWERRCDCSNGEYEEEPSTPVRGTAGVTTVSTTSTTTMTTATSATAANSSTTGAMNNEMPILYRLMPIKLLAVLLVLSLVFAIRHMVDFRRYEGIDPSDQKIAEFELLQLAEEA